MGGNFPESHMGGEKGEFWKNSSLGGNFNQAQKERRESRSLHDLNLSVCKMRATP